MSVAECVRSELPGAAYFYCSDNRNFPYGLKPESAVIGFTTDNCRVFVERFQLDLLIIACNTASTVALAEVRAALVVPVVGVVPAIKPAAQVSQSKSIALLATPATVRRSYTAQLISDFASDCRVVLHGSSALVEIAERKLLGEAISTQEIESEIAPMFAENAHVDTVVLGCTHFPLLRAELEVMRPRVRWIDSGPAIAARVRSLLANTTLPHADEGGGVALFTAYTVAALGLAPALKKYGFSQIEFLDR